MPKISQSLQTRKSTMSHSCCLTNSYVLSEATGVELHKESRWSQSWQDFKENNQYVNKVFDWKVS